MKPTRRLLAALACLLILGVAQAVDHPPPRYGTWGVDLANMDPHVRPGDDFFEHVEGTWLRTHPIPADKSSAGYGDDLPDETEKQVRDIVEAAAGNPADATARQIGDFYAAWMDEAGIERRGLAPLTPYLARIAAVRTHAQLVALMATPGYASPVEFFFYADLKDPTRWALFAVQADLGLPTRDYYLLQAGEYGRYREAYRDYIVRIERLAGVRDPLGKANAFIALETRLARDQLPPESLRDPKVLYNPMTRQQLRAFAPAMHWDETMKAIGLPTAPIVVLAGPSAVASAAQRIGDVALQSWKDYLAFRFISDHAAYLPRAFDEAHFDFYSRTLQGVPQQRERWKRGISLVNQTLGEAVGELYVARHWSTETERQVSELVGDMRAAYGEKITNASWMDEATRREALAKLAAFDPRIGHPAHYIDYSTLVVDRSNPLANALASAAFRWQLSLSRFPKPVDRGLWLFTPQTVNAYYDPTQNQITMPAAILQPPYFDPNADPAVNYAGTGATIGHEMGHGFDDQGRQFDAQGRLRDWWTSESAERYKSKAERLATQYDAYEPIPGVHIKGHLTLGENLADLGGLEAAYAAYRHYVARHGEPVVIDGLTGDQRFFLAYAAAWQDQQREGSIREQLLSDPHSPSKYRVNGVVRNLDAWYAAFDVRPSERGYLAPEQRVHLW